MGTPVATPGPSTRSSTPAQRPANSSYSPTSLGTEEQRTIPSSVESSISARRSTASSSAVFAGSVPTRYCARSSAPSKRPKTVWVLPASTASSIDRRPCGERLGVVVAEIAHPLGERLGGERRLLTVGAELLDGHITRRPELDPRDHARRPRLVPDPDILHLQLEERIRGLGDVLHVELVAQIG